jgi:hypothetical protein
MRQQILEYLLSQNLGVFTTTSELPWSENGQPLFLKNLKKVYVDREQVTTGTLVATLDAININTEVTSVKVYLASDAKIIPPNLDDTISSIRAAIGIDTVLGVNRRDSSVAYSYQGDILINELEFRFTKII